MADVAALAGVSPQTVSRVSMGHSNVRAETRNRVQRAMDDLGYVPNRAARALRSGAFKTIGVVAHHFTRTGVSQMVEAIVSASRDRGFGVSLFDVEDSTQEDFENVVGGLASAEVDGLIVLRASLSTPAVIPVPRGLPIVVGDSRFLGQHPVVGCDDRSGARLAVQHLLELGHQTVHHLRGPADSVQAQLREEAWADALREAGRELPPVLEGDWTPASGYRQGKILAANPELTAIFCANDEMAAGLYRALWEADRKVPEDVSVVGFDDVLGEFLLPPLTTIAQDFETIARALVEMLVGEIESDEPGESPQVLVPTHLVVRQSTAAPR